MKIIIYILLLLGIWSCNDLFDGYLTKKPTSDVTTENFWKNETDVETAARQVYAKYAEVFGNQTIRLYRNRALPFDYLSATWLNVSKNYLYLKWAKDAPSLSWKNEYDIISETNKVLHYMEQAGMAQERMEEYRAQMKTMRAIVHSYIASTWGKCPYKKDYFDVWETGCIPLEEVYDNCIIDLEESIPHLSPASQIRNADGTPNISKMIPSLGTAQAYLAWIYANKGVAANDPALMKKALEYALAVIQSGEYSLLPTVRDFCITGLKGNSCEGIHEIDFYDINTEINNHNACMFGPTVQYPVVPNATPATNRSGARLSYEKAKERFSPLDDWWENAFYKPDSMILLPSNQTKGAVYIYKHRNILVHADGIQKGRIRGLDENEILFRLPDMYFLVAEMYARLGDPEMAKKYLNVVRQRANGPAYTPGEGDLLRAIFKTWVKERFMEGFDFEYYLRMRFGYCNELPGDFSAETDPQRLFLPIGSDAFLNNPLMKQNTYWLTKNY